MSPVEFSTLLAGWCEKKHHFSNQRGLNQREALAILGEGGDQAKVSDWERGKMVPRNMGELLAKMEAAK